MNRRPHMYGLLTCVAAILLSGTACTKNYKEYNADPFGVPKDHMIYDGVIFGAPLAQMQNNVLPFAQQPNFGDERYQVMQNLCADIFSGYMGAPRYWVQNGDNTTYALYPSWYSMPFDHYFTYVMAPWNQLRSTTTEFNLPQIFAVAQIIKVAAMHRASDIYGPLPYLGFATSSQVNYDSQEAIYNSFFNDLASAVDVLRSYVQTNPGATILAPYDYIYHGDPQKWIKFANSLRLRLALHIVYADAAKAKIQAAAALDASRGGVFIDVADMAQLAPGAGVNFHHPLWEITNHFNDIRMGATVDSYMNGYADPRLPKYFQPAQQAGNTYAYQYRGVRTGIDIGADAANYQVKTSLLAVANNQPILWMGTPEVYFLRAEVKLRWSELETQTVQNLYETGVKKSMEMWSASVGTYLDATNTGAPANYVDPVKTGNNVNRTTTTTVPWNDTATDAVKQERISIQKWIAMYPDGLEGWTEFRRTGYPKIFPVMVNNSGNTINTATQICRLPFPTSEYLGNPAGVQTGVSLLGGADNGGTKLWWDKN